MSFSRPACFLLALAAAAPARAQQLPSGSIFADPNGLARLGDSMIPFKRCVTSPGVADPDCVGRNMQEEVKRRYGDLQPGQQTPDQGVRNFDRFFGGNLDAPYVDPGQSSGRGDDGFLYQYYYGMRGLMGPRPVPETSPGAPGTE